MPSTTILHLGYLGPEGSHSYGASCQLAAQWPDYSFDLHPYSTLNQVLAATGVSEIDFGVLPIENALEGSVLEVLEALGLQKYPLQIAFEFSIPIIHCLIGHRYDSQDFSASIETVLSHPQAIAQCRETIYQILGPHVQFETTSSTSEAVRQLCERRSLKDKIAAIGTQEAAKRFGLTLLKENISDAPDNVTRFFLLHSPTQENVSTGSSLKDRLLKSRVSYPQKTSLCIGIGDHPGALVDTLLLFKALNINLSKIESRPSRKRLGEYLFYIDIEGDLTKIADETLWKTLTRSTTFLHILGPYGCLGHLQ